MTHPHDMIQVASRALVWIRPRGLAGIRSFVLSRMNPDGGFRGRSAESDLYYTAFGLACLAAMEEPLPADQAGKYLDNFGDGSGLDFVHLASAVRCRAILSVQAAAELNRTFLRRLEEYRADDGGYNHLGKKAARGTAYGGFIAYQVCREAGGLMPQPEKLLAGIPALPPPGGGAPDSEGAAGGLVTAASAALLLKKWISGSTGENEVRTLRACECRSGGYLAFAGAPAPDLLSTATALYALRHAGRMPPSSEHHCDFISSLWSESGGFSGHPADSVADCEYTFYALLALGACVST